MDVKLFVEAGMVQIILPYKESQTEQPLHIKANVDVEIGVSSIVARRRANGYLAMEVAMMIVAGDPILFLSDRPVWRVPALLHLSGLGDVANVGMVEIDATSGEVIKLSEQQITEMQNLADAIATRLTSSATA